MFFVVDLSIKDCRSHNGYLTVDRVAQDAHGYLLRHFSLDTTLKSRDTEKWGYYFKMCCYKTHLTPSVGARKMEIQSLLSRLLLSGMLYSDARSALIGAGSKSVQGQENVSWSKIT